MPQSALFRLDRIGRARLLGAGLFVLVILVGIGWLTADLVQKVEERSESRSDNAQWLLSQFELELLNLVLAADSARHGQAELEDVRLRFDIFYGRLRMLLEGRVSDLLSRDPDFVEGFSRLDDFVQTYLPVIDGTDGALRARLQQMAADGLTLTHTARDMALAGVAISASLSDQKRYEVARTLTLTGALTAALVVFLMALLVVLLRLYRFNRVRAAENLAMLSRLDAVVSTTMEALVTVDGKGQVLDVNEAARALFGLGQGSVQGLDMAGLFRADASQTAPFRPGQGPAVDNQGRFQLTAQPRDGTAPVPVELSISRVTGMEPPLFVVFLRDLSAQLQSEQALVAARDKALAGEKAKADLLAVMSHEIRTPLNGMIGTIELLEATALSPAQKEYLEILQASGQLLMHHVNDVLNIARLDSGVARPAAGPVDLAEIAREVIRNQLPASRTNGNELTFIPPEGGAFLVQSDGAQLRQVLLNLIGNAVKFTRNGKITLTLQEDRAVGEVTLRVTDSGIGIAPRDRERIFDDFVTLDTSYARPASGTGLGLGIVRRIVTQMGGRLSLESQEGAGSVFGVHLPLRRLEPDTIPQAAPVSAPGGTAALAALSVLVIEDNEFNRMIMLEFLRQEGHDAVEAADGESGVARSEERAFDVILMDISMPGMDGVQATQAIRQGNGPSRGSPVIAMTAHALSEDLERFRQAGLGWVLVKPITRERLRAALRDAVQGAKQDTGVAAILDAGPLRGLIADLGPSRARDLVARFRAEMASGAVRLVQGLLVGSDADAARLAHKMTGSAAMFGASDLSALLIRVERALRAPAQADGAALAQELTAAIRATDAALQDEDFVQASSLR